MPGWDDGTVAAFKEILDEQRGYFDTAARMAATFGEDAPEAPAALTRALEYLLVRRPDLADPCARVYSPMIEFGGVSRPEHLKDANDATLAAWSESLELFSEFPLIVSRVADLLWLRRHGRPHEYARTAQAAFRELRSYQGLYDVERADCLQRALDLILELKLKDELGSVTSEIVVAAREALDSDDLKPGVAVPLIDRLAALPPADRPAELHQLVADATQIYAGDPFIIEGVLDIRLRLAGTDVDQRRATTQAIIDVWKSAAADASPLVAHRYLEKGLQAARAGGLSEEVEELRLQVQELGRQGQDFGKISTEVEIPKEIVDAFKRQFFEPEDPVSRLERFGSYCPVCDDDDMVEQKVRELMKQAPLGFLVSKVIFNAQNLPIKSIEGPEQHLAQGIIDHDTQSIVVWGLFAVQVLDRLIAETKPQFEDIKQALAGSFFDGPAVSAIARAFDHYAAGRYEEALLLCLPRIEAAVRNTAVELGMVVFIEPSAAKNQTGSYRLLGELLRGLKGSGVDLDRRYLFRLLADPLSLNIRNETLHGLTEEIAKRDAALVLHAVLVLSMWRSARSDSPSD